MRGREWKLLKEGNFYCFNDATEKIHKTEQILN